MAEIEGKLDVEKALKMLVYLYTDGRLEVTGITLKEQGGDKDASVLQHTASYCTWKLSSARMGRLYYQLSGSYFLL